MTEIEKLYELIKSEITDTEFEIAMLIDRTEIVAPDCAIGRVSRMDAINNKSVAEFSLVMSQEKLKGLQYRLSKYGSEKFTKCVRCNNEIPIKRLMFVPHSLTCVDCTK